MWGWRPYTLLALGAAITAALELCVHASPPAQRLRATGPISFYVAPNGIDANNDCLAKETPCGSVSHALARVMYDWDFTGHDPFIRLAPGTYPNTTIGIAGQPLGAHTVSIVGAQSEDQGCTQAQAEQVVLRGVNNAPIFFFQDLAIGVVRCMTLEGSGAVAFACRQTPTSDIAFVKLGNADRLAGVVQVNENCGMNLGGAIWLNNDIDVFLFANDLGSRITVGGGVPIIALKPVAMNYFALAYQSSSIEFRSGVTISGKISAAIGSRVWRSGAIISNGLTLPGGVTQHDPKQPGFIY